MPGEDCLVFEGLRCRYPEENMKYLIIGNGVAGTTAAETVRESDSTGEITICTEEKIPFYSRIRLIEYLAGEASTEDIIIHDEDWYGEKKISVHLRTRVQSIDADRGCVATESGESLQYDRLLLSTGGASFIPLIKGSEKQGVFSLRNIQDADDIISYAEGKKNIILIGGGVLGLEAGNSLRKRGYEITVVEFFPRLLPRQMDAEGAGILKSQMEDMGFRFYLGAKTREITGDKRADGIVLEDGRDIRGDLIIVSAGVRPRGELAQDLGLSINKGVAVNDMMETGRENVYAAGDLVEHQGNFYGIWPAARKQGEIAGINMAGGSAVYGGTTLSNKLKVVGIDLAAAGNIDADGQFEAIVKKDMEKYYYRKIVIKDNTLAGCIFYGDLSGYRDVLKAIENARHIGNIREQLADGKLDVLSDR
jgi:nitrite reductase (NADH) large subunit